VPLSNYLSPACLRTVNEKCPYNLSADVYSFGVVLWEILACATPREVLHRLQNKRQAESSERHYQKRGGGVDLLEAMACAADNAVTVAVQQRHRDGRCKLPICNCWPGEIQTMVKEALSNDPTKRPSMADLRFRLEEEAEKLGSQRRFDVARHRRSTFRIDLTRMDNTETGNGEPAINNSNDNHNPVAVVVSNSLRSRTSQDSSSQLSVLA
jgi:serine/threonine protein kinase